MEREKRAKRSICIDAPRAQLVALDRAGGAGRRITRSTAEAARDSHGQTQDTVQAGGVMKTKAKPLGKKAMKKTKGGVSTAGSGVEWKAPSLLKAPVDLKL
jgi:hypothetical protein